MVRVVVTGLGAVAPNGIGIESFWQSIVDGVSGIGPITRFDASRHDTRIAGEVKGFDPLQWVEKKEARKMDRFIHYAVATAQMAYDDSGLKVTDDNRERIGVFVGTGMGGIPALEESHKVLMEKGPGRISAFFIPSIITNLASGQISMRFGMKGPNSCVCTACATGNHAIGDSFRIIQHGDADVMLAGGSEAVITPLTIGGFCSMKALSTRNDQPTRDHPIVRGPDHPGRFLFADDLPPIGPLPMEHDLHRLIRRQPGEIAHLHPLAGFARSRRHQKICDSGRGQCRHYEPPDCVDRAYTQTPTGCISGKCSRARAQLRV